MNIGMIMVREIRDQNRGLLLVMQVERVSLYLLSVTLRTGGRHVMVRRNCKKFKVKSLC